MALCVITTIISSETESRPSKLINKMSNMSENDANSSENSDFKDHFNKSYQSEMKVNEGNYVSF